jgi:hypothetical protein
VRPKKRRKPYRRFLWLDLNKTKTGINHFKSIISTTETNFFFSKSNSRSDDNQLVVVNAIPISNICKINQQNISSCSVINNRIKKFS